MAARSRVRWCRLYDVPSWPLHAQGFLESVLSQNFFIGEDFVRRSVGGDAAISQDNGAFTEIEHEVEVVRGDGDDPTLVIRGA